jgi:hypothetical protein
MPGHPPQHRVEFVRLDTVRRHHGLHDRVGNDVLEARFASIATPSKERRPGQRAEESDRACPASTRRCTKKWHGRQIEHGCGVIRPDIRSRERRHGETIRGREPWAPSCDVAYDRLSLIRANCSAARRRYLLIIAVLPRSCAIVNTTRPYDGVPVKSASRVAFAPPATEYRRSLARQPLEQPPPARATP